MPPAGKWDWILDDLLEHPILTEWLAELFVGLLFFWI